jgi:hypothetical protein
MRRMSIPNVTGTAHISSRYWILDSCLKRYAERCFDVKGGGRGI